jgi:hypothetical protein
LALSVAVLSWLGPQAAGTAGDEESTRLVAVFWALASGSHFILRCVALQGVRFRWLNSRRAMVAAAADVEASRTGAPLPSDWASIHVINAQEPLLTPDWALPLRLHLGCSVADAIAGVAQSAGEHGDVDAFLVASAAKSDGPLAPHRFMVTWRDNTVWVVFSQEAQPTDALRAVWLATMLTAPSSSNGTGDNARHMGTSCVHPDALRRLAEAVSAMELRFDSFAAALDRSGWDIVPLLPPAAVSPRLVRSDAVSNGGAKTSVAMPTEAPAS